MRAAVDPYASAGDALYRNPETAGPTIIADVQTPDDIAMIGGSPPSGATIGYIERVAGDKNARLVPNAAPMTKNGHTAVGPDNEYSINVMAQMNSPPSANAATYFRLKRSATLPDTNTKSAIGANSARPSQPMSSSRPVMS